MLHRLSIRLTPFVALAVIGCASGDPVRPTGTAGANGTAGAQGTAGAGTAGAAGGATGTAGAGGGAAGAAGGATGTAGAAGGATGTAGAGAGGSGPACAAVTQVNQAALSLTRADISAYRYAPTPAANVMKLDYDPVNHVVVLLTKDGHFYKFDPAVAALPAATVTTPVTTATATEASYTFSGDHRGLAFGADGAMYVLSSIGVTGGNGVIIRKGVAATAGAARTWTVVAQSAGYPLPKKGANFGHSFSGLTVSPDGMYLYFSSGSRSDHGEDEEGQREVPLTSAIFRVPTSGSNLMLPNDLTMLTTAGYLYADGTRNTFDTAFNANGDLIGADNGPDMDLPDEVNWLQQGKHYGFPWRFGAENNPVMDASYSASGDMRLHAGYQAVDIASYFYDATFPAAPTGVVFVDPIMNMGPDADSFRTGKAGAPMDASTAGTGMPGITGHRSPLGLAFDASGALCGPYYKQGFMLSYGSLPQSGFQDQGQDLLMLQLNKGATAYTMNATIIAKGLKSPMDSVLVGNRLFTVGINTASPIYMFLLPKP